MVLALGTRRTRPAHISIRLSPSELRSNCGRAHDPGRSTSSNCAIFVLATRIYYSYLCAFWSLIYWPLDAMRRPTQSPYVEYMYYRAVKKNACEKTPPLEEHRLHACCMDELAHACMRPHTHARPNHSAGKADRCCQIIMHDSPVLVPT